MDYKMTETLNLQSLLVPSKVTEIEYPGLSGFTVKVSFLSREELVKIRKKATKTAFKNRQPVEELNEDLFLQLYVENTVKGWTGLKLKYLSQLAPVDLSSTKDVEQELAFTPENALSLMKSSANFDAFISETVTDLENFQ
jgi:hypothetical protein